MYQGVGVSPYTEPYMRMLKWDMPQTRLPTREQLNAYVERGLVRTSTHGALTIFCYTQTCQFERAWDDVTRMARGLVLDNTGRCCVRPLEKFYNHDEPDARRPTAAEVANSRVWEKIDGSLIQITQDREHGLIVTSKGSFRSDQVMWAREILSAQPSLLATVEPGWTFVTEIVHPANRIVIDYGNSKRLVLLAVIDNETGVERSVADYQEDWWLPRKYPVELLGDVNRLNECSDALMEGVVVDFGSYRLKYKTSTYVKIHRIVTGWSVIAVWEHVSEGKELPLADVPEEFVTWIQDTAAELQSKFHALHSAAHTETQRTLHLSDKEIGLSDMDKSMKSMVFMMRKGQNKRCDELIWKLIRPKVSAEDASAVSPWSRKKDTVDA